MSLQPYKLKGLKSKIEEQTVDKKIDEIIDTAKVKKVGLAGKSKPRVKALKKNE